MRPRLIRLQPDGLTERSDRLLCLVFIEQCQPQVRMRGAVLGTEAQGLAKVSLGTGKVPLVEGEQAAVDKDIGIVRSQF